MISSNFKEKQKIEGYRDSTGSDILALHAAIVVLATMNPWHHIWSLEHWKV